MWHRLMQYEYRGTMLNGNDKQSLTRNGAQRPEGHCTTVTPT